MQIIRKETTPNGTDIQIEDWSEDYPGTFKKNATIGIDPIALNSIYHDEGFPEYPKRGETFRSEFDFNTEEEQLRPEEVSEATVQIMKAKDILKILEEQNKII